MEIWRFAPMFAPEFIDDAHAALFVTSNGARVRGGDVEPHFRDAVVKKGVKKRRKRFAAVTAVTEVRAHAYAHVADDALFPIAVGECIDTYHIVRFA